MTADYDIRINIGSLSGLNRLESQMNMLERSLTGISLTLQKGFSGGFKKFSDDGVKAARNVKSAFSETKSEFSYFKGLVSSIGGIFAAEAIGSKILDIGTKIIKLGANMEQTRISFTTMLGSADKANKTLAELTHFAEITPFGQNEVINGAKQLLAYGFAAENLTTDLRKLGDVSAGLSIPLGDLVYLYGTIRTQGKAMTKDLMQFANRGIPIYSALTKVTGKSGAALQAMVEDGQIGFPIIEKAFNNMTQAGSMFGGLMEKQSRSLIGRFSTLKDKIEVLGIAIGEGWIPQLGKITEWAISIVEIIPRLDFSPVMVTIQGLTSQVSQLVSQFSQLISVFGASITTFDVLTIGIRYLAYSFQAAYTPIRFVLQLMTQLVNVVANAATVIQGFGNAIAGIWNNDWSRFNSGVSQMKAGFRSMAKEAAESLSTYMHDEKKGWSAIFAPINDPTKGGSSFANGGAGGGKTPAASSTGKAAGIEKIKSSTRNVTININNLIKDVTFQKYDSKSEAQMMDYVRRALLTAVNDTNVQPQ